MTITHLQVRFVTPISSSESAFQLPLFISMKSLTHLALSSLGDEEEPDANLAFSRAQGTFPPSLILCLLALTPSGSSSLKHWFADMTDACLKVDERMVMWCMNREGDVDEIPVVRSNDSFQDWCRVTDGVQTFWDLGDAVLKRRRERVGVV
ncbi:hypothetical protein DL96DRAFT_1595869 [Flagelloscypha sp. PMI_526]|nr:hypothetical protein DL96DRAFT_1595869 [Flagelloscypha sp. PMI_526]